MIESDSLMRLVWNQYKKATWPLCSRNEFSIVCTHECVGTHHWRFDFRPPMTIYMLNIYTLMPSDCILTFCLCCAVHFQPSQIFSISLLFICTEPHRTAPHRTALHAVCAVYNQFSVFLFELFGWCVWECGNRTNCHFTLADHLNATLYGILCV